MLRNLNLSLLSAVVAALLLMTGCASEVITSDVVLRRADSSNALPEDLLLDVPNRICMPVDEPAINTDTTLQNLRNAEGHYLSWQLGETLQATGHWGAIRLNPLCHPILLEQILEQR